MCRKLIYLIFFVLVFGIVGNTSGQPTGEFLLEWWFEIGGGNAVTDLINNPNFPDNPTGSAMLDIVELPQGAKPANLWEGDIDNYGARLQGYIYPPATGDYTFWITGDNGSHEHSQGCFLQIRRGIGIQYGSAETCVKAAITGKWGG